MLRQYKLLLAALFIIFFPLFIFGSFESYDLFQDRWFNCLNYMEQGSLYGGQPNCIQGPVAFSIMFLLKSIGGYYLSLAITIFSFFLFLVIFLLGNKIIKKESGKEHLVIYTILFCFLFLYFALEDFASFLGTAFFFFSVYVLFYTEFKHKELYTGILFALSIFSKFNHLVFIFVILAYYYVFKLKILKEFNYKKLKYLLYFLLPTIILFILFNLIWSNFFVYVFLTGLLVNSFTPTVLPQKAILPEMALSLYQIFKDVFSLEPFRIFILFAIIFSAISFFKNKRAITSIPSLGFFLIYMATIILRTRFYLPALLFFAILFTIEFDVIKKNYVKYLLFIFILLLFLFPALQILYLNIQLRQIQTLTTGVLESLPVPDGKILGDVSLNRLDFYGFEINKDDYVYIREPGLTVIDPYSKALEKFGVYNPKEWYKFVNNQLNPYLQEVLSGNFSMIIFSPRNYLTDLTAIMIATSSEVDKNYCIYKIPSFERKCIWCEPMIYLLLNKNQNLCTSYNDAIIDYYRNNFLKICKKSSVAGLLTKLVLVDSGWINDGEELTCEYSEKPDVLIKALWKKFFLPKQKEVNFNGINECFVLKNNTEISTHKPCSGYQDCISIVPQDMLFICKNTKFIYMLPPIACSADEDCYAFIDKEGNEYILHDSIKCSKNVCLSLESVPFDYEGGFLGRLNILRGRLNREVTNRILDNYTHLNLLFFTDANQP